MRVLRELNILSSSVWSLKIHLLKIYSLKILDSINPRLKFPEFSILRELKQFSTFTLQNPQTSCQEYETQTRSTWRY
jgi:hypothetical protein